MSINRTNLQTNSNDPRLARVDINDMFADIGYGTTGTVSPITMTGEANKLFKFSAIANTILHFFRIRKSSTTALNVQDDSSSTIFNVDTTNGIVSAKQFAVPALNPAPASPTATGTTGEVRVATSGIYYCIATNTWRKTLPVYIFIETITGLTTTFKDSTLPFAYYSNKYQWYIASGSSGGVIESTHNLHSGNSFHSLVTGATVATVSANSIYSMRIGDSVLEIRFNTGTGAISYRVASGTITEITVQRLHHVIGWL